jgi:toxin ParE1/3/4
VRLRYTLPALADLDQILDHVAAQSPKEAVHVQARIKAIADLLLHHPRIGALTNDPTIRRMTTSPYPYVIFYESQPPK